MKNLAFISMLFMLISQAALAEKTPQSVATDQRIRQVMYNSSEVYEVIGSYRFTTTIEFEKNETVQYLTLGDTIAWQAHPMGHRVHLKPVEPRAETNLTVVTDKRTYYFLLTAANPKNKLDATYLLRFNYSSNSDISINPNAVRVPVNKETKESAATYIKARNCKYSISGSNNIQLVRACDDDQFTYLEFAERAEWPAVFAVDSFGNESLMNYRKEGKLMVIEKLESLYTLRLGDYTLCLFSDDRPFKPDESIDRTSIKHGRKS